MVPGKGCVPCVDKLINMSCTLQGSVYMMCDIPFAVMPEDLSEEEREEAASSTQPGQVDSKGKAKAKRGRPPKKDKAEDSKKGDPKGKGSKVIQMEVGY